MPNLGDIMPDFTAKATDGTNDINMNFHEYIADGWAILFSHPADFTPVCTTELAKAQNHFDEFEKRGVKMCALSCDPVELHKEWIVDIKKYTTNGEFKFPIIDDTSREVAKKLGMIDPEEKDAAGLPMTARAVFIVKDKKLKLSILYPATTGRNFDEILRVIDSLQLTAKKSVATPVNWKVGDQKEVMATPKLTDDEAAALGTMKKHEVPSKKGYMRFVTLHES